MSNNKYSTDKPVTYAPVMSGQRWSEEEEKQLLDELECDMDIDFIAERHYRTVGGIISRCKEIAYKLYVGGNSVLDISGITRLQVDEINEYIQRKQNAASAAASNTKKIQVQQIQTAIL